MRGVRVSLAAGGFLAAALLCLPAGAASRPTAKTSPRPGPPILYRYVFDGRKSRVSFTFRGVVIPHDGYFGVLKGEIFLGARDLIRNAAGNMEIRAASVRAEKSDQQWMLHHQVLEAPQFPAIELRVSGVEVVDGPVVRRFRYRRSEKTWRLRAAGMLKIHGAEKKVPISFHVSDTGTNLYIRGRGVLRLSDFGMSRPRVLLVVPGSDTVEVRVRIVAAPAPRREDPDAPRPSQRR